jgi:hypothetical protein
MVEKFSSLLEAKEQKSKTYCDDSELAEKETEANIFLTAKEVAENFFQGKINYKNVLEMTKLGILPARKVGKKYLYLDKALQDWVKENMYKPVWMQMKRKKQAA